MKNSTVMNIMNEYLVYKNQSLGKGATGEVYLGKSVKDKTEVAVKVIELKTIDNEVTEYLLNMEKIALMSVVNPHVLRGVKVIQNNQFCFLVTELCNGGTLKSLIKVNGPLGEEKSLKYLLEVLKGECSLIGKGIIHRDLKPANILLHNG
jgi:serine/threonine protein kinase